MKPAVLINFISDADNTLTSAFLTMQASLPYANTDIAKV
jgi:hypothetical protein